MASGDHLYVRRGLRYSHHGIDCGDGSVIHYIGPRRTRFVARTSLAEFAATSKVRVRSYDKRLSAEVAVRNAESRLGLQDYSLVRNNCEHFAAWCCTGRSASAQVRRWVLGAQGAVATFVAAQSVGAHLALAGTAGAGFVAMLRPLRRRRRWQRSRAADLRPRRIEISGLASSCESVEPAQLIA
jgi:hypothetical protein